MDNPFLKPDIAGSAEPIQTKESIVSLSEMKRIDNSCIIIQKDLWESIRPGDFIYYIRADNNKLTSRLMVLKSFRVKTTGILFMELCTSYGTKIATDKKFLVNTGNIKIIYKEVDPAMRQIMNKLEPRVEENPFLLGTNRT